MVLVRGGWTTGWRAGAADPRVAREKVVPLSQTGAQSTGGPHVILRGLPAKVARNHMEVNSLEKSPLVEVPEAAVVAEDAEWVVVMVLTPEEDVSLTNTVVVTNPKGVRRSMVGVDLTTGALSRTILTISTDQMSQMKTLRDRNIRSLTLRTRRMR